MLDRYWLGDVVRISPEAPVPILAVRREEARLGGAANVALNVATFGAKTTLLGVVGEDEPARALRALLAEAEVLTKLHSDVEMPTTLKLRMAGHSQQLLRADFESQPSSTALDGLSFLYEGCVADHDALILSDYGKGGLARVAHKIAIARERGIPVVVDPKGRDYTPYQGATIITPNRSELAAVVGDWSSESDLVERATSLRRALELDALLVTRSEEGMSLFDDAGHLRVDAEAREVFDVTGAGDTVAAVMGAMLAAGATPREAVPIANRAAAIVVGKFGTASVTLSEVFT